MTADRLFQEMLEDIDAIHLGRTSTDGVSPAGFPSIEAAPGRMYVISGATSNIITCKPINDKWAMANVLHFFADTEAYGEVLRRVNPNADRFLTGDRWVGAYGAIAMPQVRKCVSLLNESPYSRRAIVSMGGFCDDPDINRPSCWNFLHFLRTRGQLDMMLYQRSLNVWDVMPYDLILLTNLIRFVAYYVSLAVGDIHWMVGSSHRRDVEYKFAPNLSPMHDINFHPHVLSSSEACVKALKML